MQWNQFLFPAPTSSYKSSGFIGDIIYIPKYSRCEKTFELKQFDGLDKDEIDPNDKIMKLAMQHQRTDKVEKLSRAEVQKLIKVKDESSDTSVPSEKVGYAEKVAEVQVQVQQVN